MNDRELDLLLAEYRKKRPTDLQMRKWKNAVRAELRKPPRVNKTWVQLIAACAAGFVAGAMFFKSDVEKTVAEKSPGNATIEYVFVKTN